MGVVVRVRVWLVASVVECGCASVSVVMRV